MVYSHRYDGILLSHLIMMMMSVTTQIHAFVSQPSSFFITTVRIGNVRIGSSTIIRSSRSSSKSTITSITSSSLCTANDKHRIQTSLFALTERQMQFWEDVEDGLEDIESVYKERGLDIDRIRIFAKRAQGELPLPSPLAKYHQPSEEHLDDLTAQPFWDATQDVSNFPWAKKLEQDSLIIIQELEEKLKREEQEEQEKASNSNSSTSIFTGDSAWQNKVMGGGWSAFRLQRLGEWNVENCKEFPKTFELLRSLNIPFAVRGICFARQAAGSGVQPHSDGRNFILTSHLGLKIPKGCWIKVGDEEATWENGKLITIDTSFEHSTGNPTESDRHVLIIDFWHPETTEAERAALDFIYSLRNKYESGKIPFRKPRRVIEEEEGQGLQGMFRSLFSK